MLELLVGAIGAFAAIGVICVIWVLYREFRGVFRRESRAEDAAMGGGTPRCPKCGGPMVQKK